MTTTHYSVILLSALVVLALSCGSGGSNNLPPNPGSDGKATLEGIDSNNNGVRDDLEIAIYEYAPKEEEARLRKAMMQDAKATQLAIIAGHTKDPQKIEEASLAISRSVRCATSEIRSQYENWDFLNYMERKAANTPARVEAYMRYNEARSGKVTSMNKDPNPCR